VASVKDKGLK